MIRKIAAGLLALLAALGLAACGGGEDGSEGSSTYSQTVSAPESVSEGGSGSAPESVPESESGADEPSGGGESASEPVPEESAEEESVHSVILCNGLSVDVTALRVREAGSEYWSFEILGGERWASGSAIELQLDREEWAVDGGWEVEAELADGTAENYTIPLGEYGIVELRPDGEFGGA